MRYRYVTRVMHGNQGTVLYVCGSGIYCISGMTKIRFAKESQLTILQVGNNSSDDSRERFDLCMYDSHPRIRAHRMQTQYLVGKTFKTPGSSGRAGRSRSIINWSPSRLAYGHLERVHVCGASTLSGCTMMEREHPTYDVEWRCFFFTRGACYVVQVGCHSVRFDPLLAMENLVVSFESR
jgi:hypothetical protein